ncbi:MAG: hypothetical protein HY981_03170 [Candidatus Magasanikbacteria bacterium]|nr:hypothetical protein [Candidatus Magasanikbacteria bacterium]
MATIEHIMKTVSEHAVPEGLHQRIIRSVALLRLQRHFFMFFALLVVSLAVAAGNVWVKFIDIEGLNLLRLMVQSFDMSIEETRDVFDIFMTFFPVWSIAIFAVHILLVGYMSYFFFVLRKITRPVP